MNNLNENILINSSFFEEYKHLIKIETKTPVIIYIDEINIDEINNNNYKILIITKHYELNSNIFNYLYSNNNYLLFNKIITFDKNILEFNNSIKCLYGGKTIVEKNENQIKNKHISFLIDKKTKTLGHLLVHQVYYNYTKINKNFEIYISSKKPIYNLYNKEYIGDDLNSKKILFNNFSYNLCIEDYSQNNYFSEKIINCFQTMTVPIYWGCPNIGDFFDLNGIIFLNTNNIDEIIKIINSIDLDNFYNNNIESINNNFKLSNQYLEYPIRLINIINECLISNKENNNVNVILYKYIPLMNPKQQDLVNIYFKKYYNLHYYDENESIQFINNNNNSDSIIIFFFESDINDYHINIMNYIQNNNNLIAKILFVTSDWWKIHQFDFCMTKQNYFISNIFKANNYKVITFSDNIEQLNEFHNLNFNSYKENIIHINYASSYQLSLCVFNENPIELICVSGQTNEIHYPERNQMLNFENIFHYKYQSNETNNLNNNFNISLNSYLCCFTSSVYIYNNKFDKICNTNIILLKTFEILGAGSLLLMPLTEEKYLKKYGIINNENCILLDFTQNLQEQINSILSKENRNIIDKIRLNGHKHAINNLNSEKMFLKIRNIIGS